MNLANKYRPRDFDDVVYQNVPVTVLKNHIENNNLQPAYLFVGAAGCGKTTVARIVANKVSTNIVEIDGASNNSVENVRRIIDDAKMAPIGGGKKVYIIDEVHMLSASAFNALLKTLEEPPAHVLFILATTELHKVPQTIQSRCMFFRFHPIPANKIYERLLYILAEEGIESYEDEAVRQVAKMGNGGMRRAISLLDRLISYGQGITMESLTLIGMETFDDYFECINALTNKDFSAAYKLIAKSNIYALKDILWSLLRVCLDVSTFAVTQSFDTLTIPKTKESVDFIKSVDLYSVEEFINKVLMPLLRGSYKYTDENIESVIRYYFMAWCSRGVEGGTDV